MALQATGQGSRPPVAAAAAAADDDDDQDPAQRPVSVCGTGSPKSAAAGFPDDAVVEILSRLPAKPLCRSKCVSKDWCQLISERLRCNKLPQTLEGFFFECVDYFPPIRSEDNNEGCSEDANEGGSEGGGEDGGGCGCKDEELAEHVHGNFVNLSGKSVPLVDPLFTSLRKQPGFRSLVPLDSCNGLLLFGCTLVPDDHVTRSYIVYNPATEHWVHVPSSDFKYGSLTLEDHEDIEDNDWDSSVSTYTYLIFDPVASSHFQLIEFYDHSPYVDYVDLLDIQLIEFFDRPPVVSVVYNYSSETGKWSNVTSEKGGLEKGVEWDLCKTIRYMRGSTIFNKMLHLIISPSYIGPELIAAINGKGETYKVISWPGNRGFPIFVGQSKGLLHCLSVSGHPDDNSCHETTELSVWVLKDYDAEEWELKHTVSYLELFGKQSCHFDSDYSVATLHPEENLIFFVQHWDYKLVSYDMDCKKLHALCTVGRDYEPVLPYVPYFSETPVLSSKAQPKKALYNRLKN